MAITRRTLLRTGASAAVLSFHARLARAVMIEPVTVAEQLMYSTSRIVGHIPNSSNVKTGTGFFFNFPTADGEKVPVLITNKHVIEGTLKLQFLLHTASVPGSKKPDANAAVESISADWIMHPDPKVDLCAVLLGPVMNSMQPLLPFFRAIEPILIKTDEELKELNAVEDVLMVGYPNGLWDAANNFPLLRRGITASHPAVDFDVEGVPTSVIDIASFPGSSGSPVFIYNNGTITDKLGNMTLGSRAIFLGVLYSGPTYQPDGTIVIRNIPTMNVAVPQVNIMMNLGYIIKAKEVLELGKAIFTKHGLKMPAPPVPPETKQ